MVRKEAVLGDMGYRTVRVVTPIQVPCGASHYSGKPPFTERLAFYRTTSGKDALAREGFRPYWWQWNHDKEQWKGLGYGKPIWCHSISTLEVCNVNDHYTM